MHLSMQWMGTATLNNVFTFVQYLSAISPSAKAWPILTLSCPLLPYGNNQNQTIELTCERSYFSTYLVTLC